MWNLQVLGNDTYDIKPNLYTWVYLLIIIIIPMFDIPNVYDVILNQMYEHKYIQMNLS